MYFNKLIYIFLSLLVLQACDLPLGEEPPKTLAPQAELGFERKCLSNVLPIMARFMTGEAKPTEIETSWNCFSTGLDLFYRKVRGRNSNEYSSEELARFFEDFFFEDLTLSPSLRLQIMRLKQVLVGGTESTLTREELQGLVKFGQVAKVASLEILPHMKILSLNWTLDPNHKIEDQIAEFNRADAAFQKFLLTIGSQIQKNNTDYRLSYLVTLLEEISDLYDKSWPLVGQIKQLLPLIEDMKASLIGGDGALITGAEWSHFSLLIGRGYIQYLRYFYFIKNYPLELAEYDVLFLGNAFDDLFSYLADMLRIKPDRALTKSDLQLAITSLRALFPDLNVTNDFIDQVFLIKKLFLGGSANLILATEFDLGREKVMTLANLGARFYSYNFIYFLRWLPESPMSDRERRTLAHATREIELIGRELGLLFESDYDLANLEKLLNEISELFNWEPDERVSFSEFRKILPAIIATKKIITASSSTVIKKSEWPMVSQFSTSIFGDYLHYWYGVKLGPSWRESFNDYQILADRVQMRFFGLLSTHQGVIRQFHLDNILLALREAGLIKDDPTLKAIQRISELLIQKILWPVALNQAGEEPVGISKDHVETLFLSFGNFASLHNWSINQLPKTGTISRVRMRNLINQIAPIALQNRANAIWGRPIRNLTSDTSFLLNFSKANLNQFDRISFQNQNLIRTLAELIATAYSGARSNFNLTKSEYDQLFADLLPILIELNFVDKDNTSFAESRFLEANLFTPSANGNQIMEYAETVELIQFLLSGLQRHALVLNAVTKNCPEFKTRGMNTSFKLDCWLAQSRASLGETYQSMPEALNSFSKLGFQEFEKIWTAFLIGTGHKLNDYQLVPIDEFSLVPHLVQYSESIMYRFDRDQNQHLTRDEAMDAYPVFRETLRSAVSIRSERMLRGGYAYLLVHKRLPITLSERVSFITRWIYREDSWPIWVDRPGLAEVLKAIAGFLQESRETTQKEFQSMEKVLPPEADWDSHN